MQAAALRSLFLANPLTFTNAANGAAKTNADVGRHGTPLSPGTSDRATADESHQFLFGFPHRDNRLAKFANGYVLCDQSLFGFRNRKTRLAKSKALGVWSAAISEPDDGSSMVRFSVRPFLARFASLATKQKTRTLAVSSRR